MSQAGRPDLAIAGAEFMPHHFLPPAVIRPNVFMPTGLSSAKCIAAPSQMYCVHKCTEAPSRAKWITCSATWLTLQTCNEPNSTGVEQSLADYIIQAFCRWMIQRSSCKIYISFCVSSLLATQNNHSILRSTFETQRRFLSFLISEWYPFSKYIVPPFTLQCFMWCSYSDNNVFQEF